MPSNNKKIIHIRELLEAGAHFGHRANVWNPKMSKYIFTKRNKVHVIDLQKTTLLLEKAYTYVRNLVANGGKVLFVGTKKQARQVILEEAKRCNSVYMNHRWIGGLLTNFKVISKSIAKLKKYNEIIADENSREDYSKKELTKLKKKADKMMETLGGIMDMNDLPDLIFVADAFHDKNVVSEARLLGIPVCAIVDTNADPETVDIILPANDDAIRSIRIFTSRIANAVIEGQEVLRNRGIVSDSERSIADEEAMMAKNDLNVVEDVSNTSESKSIEPILEQSKNERTKKK